MSVGDLTHSCWPTHSPKVGLPFPWPHCLLCHCDPHPHCQGLSTREGSSQNPAVVYSPHCSRKLRPKAGKALRSGS